MSHLFPYYLSSIIRSVSRFIYIYAFYSLFLGLSPAHTLINVTFDSIIYALYSLSGLSLAHICLLSGFYASWIYIYMLSTASKGLPLVHTLLY